MKRLLTAFVFLAAASSQALGQVTSEPQRPDEAPLAGHPVQPQPARITILERDFQGKVRRADPTPTHAAVAALKLDTDTREKVDKILADRSRILEHFVEENLDLLTKLGGFEQAPPRDKFLLAAELFQKLEPLRTSGPFDKQVRDCLTPDQARAFDNLLKEYWDAIVEEAKHAPKPKGRLGIIIEERLKDLGREVEAAYHRCEKSGAVLYGYLFKSMTLTNDQSKRLHELCANYSATGLDNKDKATQTTFFLSVTAILDADQRKLFVQRLQGKK
jgi:hypothetical protein